ncbi:hypothetical protein PR048_003085 [Dryococelus australis]|uniref:Uncharacterized protein n=1 Tax=Dryococelus australis TaxID=614101 RepID=A0ABQ9IM09_9NEOP|nr:hypothetical protein PR048_003085 [Dryococelus australis]
MGAQPVCITGDRTAPSWMPVIVWVQVPLQYCRQYCHACEHHGSIGSSSRVQGHPASRSVYRKTGHSSVMAPTPYSLFCADIRISNPWLKVGRVLRGATSTLSTKIARRSGKRWGLPVVVVAAANPLPHESDAFQYIHHAPAVGSPQIPAVRIFTLSIFQYLEIPLPVLIVGLPPADALRHLVLSCPGTRRPLRRRHRTGQLVRGLIFDYSHPPKSLGIPYPPPGDATIAAPKLPWSHRTRLRWSSGRGQIPERVSLHKHDSSAHVCNSARASLVTGDALGALRFAHFGEGDRRRGRTRLYLPRHIDNAVCATLFTTRSFALGQWLALQCAMKCVATLRMRSWPRAWLGAGSADSEQRRARARRGYRRPVVASLLPAKLRRRRGAVAWRPQYPSCPLLRLRGVASVRLLLPTGLPVPGTNDEVDRSRWLRTTNLHVPTRQKVSIMDALATLDLCSSLSPSPLSVDWEDGIAHSHLPVEGKADAEKSASCTTALCSQQGVYRLSVDSEKCEGTEKLQTWKKNAESLESLPKRAFFDKDINVCVKKLDIPYFRGVYMRDNLPKKPNLCECMIVNLDSKQNERTPWVALIKNVNRSFYYDRFGDLHPQIEIHNYYKMDQLPDTIDC